MWIPARPALPPTSFGISGHGYEPPVPGRAIRFADVAHARALPGEWQPQVRVPQWDAIEPLGEEIFAELAIERER